MRTGTTRGDGMTRVETAEDMTDEDFRTTPRGRRQAWFGLKPSVKKAAATPLLHPVLRAATALAPGLHSGRLPAPAHLREVRGSAAGASFVLVDPDRCEIAKELYWGRGRRPVERDAFALDIMVALSRDADEFVDIGAYTGVFSVATLAGNASLHAHAFEMIPAVAAGLSKNVERNGMSARLTLHPTGVGAAGARMRVPSGEGGSALPSFYSANMSFADGVEVEFVSLDGLAAEVPPGSRVTMKIDVEGAENQVLAHGQEFLGEFLPDILCEVLPGEADGAELESLLAPHGYRYHLVRDVDLFERRTIEPDDDYRDWLFTTRTREDLEERLGPVLA